MRTRELKRAMNCIKVIAENEIQRKIKKKERKWNLGFVGEVEKRSRECSALFDALMMGFDTQIYRKAASERK